MSDAVDANPGKQRGVGRRAFRDAMSRSPDASRARPGARARSDAAMAEDPNRRRPPTRAAFARFVPTTTRWRDIYGHLNNVAYYALFDSAVNAILTEAGWQVLCQSYLPRARGGRACGRASRPILSQLSSRGVQGGGSECRRGRPLHSCICCSRLRPSRRDSRWASAVDGGTDGWLVVRCAIVRRVGGFSHLLSRKA
jgi:hypothetical protein